MYKIYKHVLTGRGPFCFLLMAVVAVVGTVVVVSGSRGGGSSGCHGCCGSVGISHVNLRNAPIVPRKSDHFS